MRKEAASIIALAALGLAEELTPNDVPLACANICGPIVELSVMCDMDGTTNVQELKRRKLAHVPRTLPQGKKVKRQVVPPQTSGPRTTRSMGQFKTIPFGTSTPAAPTTPPNVAQPVEVEPNLADGAVANPPIINLRPTNTPTVINPLFPDLIGPSTPPQSRPPSSTPTPTPSFSSISTTTSAGGGAGNLPIGNGGTVSPTGGTDAGDGVVDGGDVGGGTTDDAGGTTGDVTDDVGSIRDDAGMLWPGQKQKQEEENRERLCFCQNKSFDIARVAGLCASCINQMGDDKNPIDSILTMCNFTVEEYEPAKDSVAVGVKVKLSSAAGRPSAGLLAVGVALGLVGLVEALL
ncbi:hypothetical protein B0T11DRAFT_23605 [Plectosphaerella cucumerina]|uniref:Uncharacterized protein n=1 Tax=Plectosphaerella cucumerina TaxID=40658 RepID=A0A8K0X9B3_9PEZI|nr:hypothetical protein B0T11DRAFT_23605 [Plectosphaerella cucumerina]